MPIFGESSIKYYPYYFIRNSGVDDMVVVVSEQFSILYSGEFFNSVEMQLYEIYIGDICF